MSPSWTTYSFPSMPSLPAARQAASDLSSTKSSYLITSARMKPFSKSVWMTPAALGALSPTLIVQARHSSAPAVK